jgi:hypothetical protein
LVIYVGLRYFFQPSLPLAEERVNERSDVRVSLYQAILPRPCPRGLRLLRQRWRMGDPLFAFGGKRVGNLSF